MLGVHGFSDDTAPAVRRRVVAALILAVLGISSSAVLVRGMDAPPLSIAAWRTLGAGLLLSPAVLRDLRGTSRGDLRGIGLAGVALAGHFWAWFASLQHTTVLRSTVLVCLVPLWTGLFEAALHRRPPPARFWMGLGVALPGVALMTTDGASEATLGGDLLAVLGGLLWAVYLLVGRSVRQRVGIGAYMGLVCFAAAAALWPVALALGEPLSGFSTGTWGLLVAAILGPQLLGHQGSNYAVAWLPASVVAAVLLLEPVGATLLAALLLGEIPTPMAAVGGLLVVGGVVRATLATAPR